jgi:glucokinase
VAEKRLILAGDIGGTKTELAIFSVIDGKLYSEVKERFPSKEFTGLESVLKKFLTNHTAAVEHACFGVAGPVVAGQVETPNLPWVVEGQMLASLLQCGSVSLLNDLEATAYGLFTLEPHELIGLNDEVKRRPANQALIAAGTGLGEALLYDDGLDYHPIASEGGHGDFAPTNETEIGLLRYLMEKFGHASYERVVSGPGIANIYNFLTQTGRLNEPGWLTEKILAAADPSAAITQAALSGESEVCVKTLDLFVSVYGAEAGNLALRAKAIGGVYVGGGIAPKILDKLEDGTFMRSFTDKGRYRELLSAVPVRVVLNQETALQGAAYYAAFRSHG